jgi:hypothetical protein
MSRVSSHLHSERMENVKRENFPPTSDDKTFAAENHDNNAIE